MDLKRYDDDAGDDGAGGVVASWLMICIQNALFGGSLEYCIAIQLVAKIEVPDVDTLALQCNMI